MSDLSPENMDSRSYLDLNDADKHQADLELISLVDEKLANQLDKVHERLQVEVQKNPNDIDARTNLLQLQEVRGRMASVGRKISERLSDKENKVLANKIEKEASKLRASLYRFDVVNDTISSFNFETQVIEIDKLIIDATKKNPEKIKSSVIESAKSALIDAYDSKNALSEVYGSASGRQLNMRFYLDIINQALDSNISHLIQTLGGVKLDDKELKTLEKKIKVDPQSILGAVKLLKMRIEEADKLLSEVDDVYDISTVEVELKTMIDTAIFTGQIDADKVRSLLEEFKDISSNFKFLKDKTEFKYALTPFDRFSMHEFDRESDSMFLSDLLKSLKALKSSEFKLYLSVIGSLNEDTDVKELTSIYKKLNIKFGMTHENLVRKYGETIGFKFFEILESIKQELINREVISKIDSGGLDLSNLLNLTTGEDSEFVQMYDATDDFQKVQRPNESFNEIGEIVSSERSENINDLIENSHAYLILVREGKGLRVYLTQRYYVDSSKLKDEKTKATLPKGSLDALQNINGVVNEFNVTKKLIVENYLMEKVETNYLTKKFYRGNKALAAGDIVKAKRAYLSFLDGYKQVKNGVTKKAISENQLFEAKTHLKNIAKVELIQIVKGIDAIIASVEYDVHKKSLTAAILYPYVGMSPNEGYALVSYLKDQKKALKLASNLLKSDGDTVTVEQALKSTDAPTAPNKLKRFDLLSDLRWAHNSREQRKLAKKLGKEKLYNATQYFYEQSFGDLIGEFANQEYEHGKLVFENYYDEHSNKGDLKKKASDRAMELRDHDIDDIEEKMSDLQEEMRDLTNKSSYKFDNSREELMVLASKKAELESTAYLEALEEQILSNMIVDNYKIELFSEVTKWAKKHKDDYRAGIWLEEFEGHYIDTDSEWYEFWGGTDKERLEFFAGLAFDIPMVAASGGIAGIAGKKVAMMTARRFAVEEFANLTLRQVSRKAGTNALVRTVAARGTGFLVECEAFNSITLLGSSVSAGGLDPFINQHWKGLGHTLVTLGTLKVTGSALSRVSGMRGLVGQYALTPIVDTAALTTTQYVLERGDLDVRRAIRGNLVLSFGIRAGHGIAGLGHSPVSGRGRVAREIRNDIIESELKGILPKATVEGGRVKRWLNNKKSRAQVDYVADYIRESGVVDSKGNPTSKGAFDKITDFTEAYELAKFARERGIGVEFLAERCKTPKERLELRRRVLELEKNGLSGIDAGSKYLEMYRSEGLDKAVFEAFVSSPEAKMSDVFEVHKFLRSNPETGLKLVEGMSNANGYDLLDLVIKTQTPPGYIESTCRSASAKTDFVKKFHEFDESLPRDKRGRVSMEVQEFLGVMTGQNSAAAAVLASRDGVRLTVEKGSSRETARKAKKITEYFTYDPLVARASIEGLSVKEAMEFLDFSVEHNQTSFDWITKGLSPKGRMEVVNRVKELKGKLTEDVLMTEFRSGKEGRAVAEILASRNTNKLNFSLENIMEIFNANDSYKLGSDALLKYLKKNPANVEKVIGMLDSVLKELGPEFKKMGMDPSLSAEFNAIAGRFPGQMSMLTALYEVLPKLPKKSRNKFDSILTKNYMFNPFIVLVGGYKVLSWAFTVPGGIALVGGAVGADASYRSMIVRNARNAATAIDGLIGADPLPVVGVDFNTYDLSPATLTAVNGHTATPRLIATSEINVLQRLHTSLSRLSILSLRTNSLPRYRTGLGTLDGTIPFGLEGGIDAVAVTNNGFTGATQARININTTLTSIRRLNGELTGLPARGRVEIQNEIAVLNAEFTSPVTPTTARQTAIRGDLAALQVELTGLAGRGRRGRDVVEAEKATHERALIEQLDAYNTAYDAMAAQFTTMSNIFNDVAVDWHGWNGRGVEALKLLGRPALYSPRGTFQPYRALLYLPIVMGILDGIGGFSSTEDGPSAGNVVAATASAEETNKTVAQEKKQATAKEQGAEPSVPKDENYKITENCKVPKKLYLAPNVDIKKSVPLITDLKAHDMKDEAKKLENSIEKIKELRDSKIIYKGTADERNVALQTAVSELKDMVHNYTLALDLLELNNLSTSGDQSGSEESGTAVPVDEKKADEKKTKKEVKEETPAEKSRRERREAYEKSRG
jgi:hypothetical protein